MPALIKVVCNQCGAKAYTENGDDPDGALVCACCPQDHNHGHAANACPGNHEGAACPASMTCIVLTPEGEECPGGHCALGVPGCLVCRPATLYMVGVVA